MQEEKLVVFSLALGAIGLYGSFLSPVSYIAMEVQSEDEKRIVRESELMGTAHLVVVGAMTSFAAKSPFPLILAALFSLSMYVCYEYALSRVPIDKVN